MIYVDAFLIINHFTVSAVTSQGESIKARDVKLVSQLLSDLIAVSTRGADQYDTHLTIIIQSPKTL